MSYTLLNFGRFAKNNLLVIGGLMVCFNFVTDLSAQNLKESCDTSDSKVICSLSDSTGFVWEVHRYKKNQKWGNWQYYNAKGEMIKQIYYKRDRRIWSYQYRDGEVIESINKKGKIKIFKGCGC